MKKQYAIYKLPNDSLVKFIHMNITIPKVLYAVISLASRTIRTVFFYFVVYVLYFLYSLPHSSSNEITNRHIIFLFLYYYNIISFFSFTFFTFSFFVIVLKNELLYSTELIMNLSNYDILRTLSIQIYSFPTLIEYQIININKINVAVDGNSID